jgi:hypothetical protein
MYICHFSLYDLSLVRAVGGLRKGFEGAQDHDLALRISERVRREQVVHIPRVLYHWRESMNSTAFSPSAKPYAAPAVPQGQHHYFHAQPVRDAEELHCLDALPYAVSTL